MIDDYPTASQMRTRFASVAYTDAGVDKLLNVWDKWIAEYTRQQREEAFALGVDYQWKHRPMGNRTAWNPYRKAES